MGQVTKDGGLAGPRTLEHLVNCVLSFEGDDLRAHRVLRATKNRFGSTNETGLFEMRPAGLVSVEDPTRLYLAEAGERVGSCVFPAIEGSRALLVEVQALVGHTEVVPPRRVAIGVDRTRLAQVIAVLSRHAGLRLGDAGRLRQRRGRRPRARPRRRPGDGAGRHERPPGGPPRRGHGGVRGARPDGRGAPGGSRGPAPRRGGRPRHGGRDHASRGGRTASPAFPGAARQPPVPGVREALEAAFCR